MEAFFASVSRTIQGNEFQKRYLLAVRVAFAIAALSVIAIALPRSLRNGIALVITGIVWHLVHAESAAAFWKGFGMSDAAAQILAVLIGLALSVILCVLGLYGSSLKHPQHAARIASHRWTGKWPYAAIVGIGLFSPILGVVIGIVIARKRLLSKTPAAAAILTANFIKLCGWGRLTVFLFSHLPFAHYLLFR